MVNARIFDEPAAYQIKVSGCLDLKWGNWFDDITVTALSDDETLLTGLIADQAALHGLLAKLRDLGLPILLVKRLEPDERWQHSRA
ncbi:MAG: hypothetical protein GY952_04180, partial [Rhodobacteraceae bacterium]|nr:hypothetical protein [Paracoccaceae bacterium]